VFFGEAHFGKLFGLLAPKKMCNSSLFSKFKGDQKIFPKFGDHNISGITQPWKPTSFIDSTLKVG